MYYFDDGKFFKSKISAIEYGRKNKLSFKLYYHDETYSNVDWSVEPSQNLDYYYLEQAKRIRDTYDRVILCYSGGYDSTNILETFYYNNLTLDKIVTVGAFSQDSKPGVDENHNGEIYHNVFPYLKSLNLEKITQIIDYTTLFDDPSNFSIFQYGENWVDEIGIRLSPHNWFWRDIEKYIVPETWKNKTVAILFGKDKPTLFWSNGSVVSKVKYKNFKPGFAFSDTAIKNYGNIESFENTNRINFYWDYSYPFILIKQLHILNRAYIAGYDIGNPDKLIYNLKTPLVFKSPKSIHNHLSLRDYFLLKKKNSSLYKFYLDGIRRLYNQTQINGITEFREKFIFSKFYYIE